LIQINKASLNTVILTLSESKTLSNPVYLFEFYNVMDKNYKYFIAQDISSYKDRYNKFVIEEKASPNNLIGQVTLTLGGYYQYKIYEQLSTTNLDPLLCDNLTPLETGKVHVIQAITENVKYDYTPTTVVYNG
jgi:hypothetical protein